MRNLIGRFLSGPPSTAPAAAGIFQVARPTCADSGSVSREPSRCVLGLREHRKRGTSRPDSMSGGRPLGVVSRSGVAQPMRRVGARPLVWLFGLSVLALGLMPSVSVEAAKVRGKVVGFKFLRNPVWVEAQDPSRHLFSFREAVPTVSADARQLYPHIPKEICIAALAAGPQKAPPPVLIRIGGGRTTPVTIVVPPMTQLSFQNTDPFPHRIYGVGSATFTPNDTMRGANRDWTVPAPGIYEIRDEAAPSLRMWIIAEPNVAAFAYPSLKGEFALTLNEPGEYTVQAYFAGKATGPATVVKVDQSDVEMKSPVIVAKANEKKDQDKSEADKPAEGKDKDDKGADDKQPQEK
jgi:hypothetical protein